MFERCWQYPAARAGALLKAVVAVVTSGPSQASLADEASQLLRLAADLKLQKQNRIVFSDLQASIVDSHLCTPDLGVVPPSQHADRPLPANPDPKA